MRDVQPGDEIVIECSIKVEQVTHKGNESHSLVSGWTEDGVYVIVPLSAVVERFPRLGNDGETVPEEINEDDPSLER